MVRCPICKNKEEFVCETCSKCGFNYINGTFTSIQVNVHDLQKYVSQETLKELIEKHRRFKTR